MSNTTTEDFSATLNCTDQIKLENGWCQLQFNCTAALKLLPNSLLEIDSIKIPILWQNSQHDFLAVLPPQYSLNKKTQWLNFSIVSKPTPRIDLTKTWCILECHGDGLFAAIHQIYICRQLQKPLPNIIVVADAVPLPAFKLQPSRIYSALFPAEVTASLGLFDDWQVAARFSNVDWQPGCFLGSIEALVEAIELNLEGQSICKLKY